MFKNVKAFSSFSVDDLKVAKRFYAETLDLNVDETPEGLVLHVAGGADVFIYPKADHAAATFTILNFPVSDVEKTVDGLTGLATGAGAGRPQTTRARVPGRSGRAFRSWSVGVPRPRTGEVTLAAGDCNR